MCVLIIVPYPAFFVALRCKVLPPRIQRTFGLLVRSAMIRNSELLICAGFLLIHRYFYLCWISVDTNLSSERYSRGRSVSLEEIEMVTLIA